MYDRFFDVYVKRGVIRSEINECLIPVIFLRCDGDVLFNLMCLVAEKVKENGLHMLLVICIFIKSCLGIGIAELVLVMICFC